MSEENKGVDNGEVVDNVTENDIVDIETQVEDEGKKVAEDTPEKMDWIYSVMSGGLSESTEEEIMANADNFNVKKSADDYWKGDIQKAYETKFKDKAYETFNADYIKLRDQLSDLRIAKMYRNDTKKVTAGFTQIVLSPSSYKLPESYSYEVNERLDGVIEHSLDSFGPATRTVEEAAIKSNRAYKVNEFTGKKTFFNIEYPGQKLPDDPRWGKFVGYAYDRKSAGYSRESGAIQAVYEHNKIADLNIIPKAALEGDYKPLYSKGFVNTMIHAGKDAGLDLIKGAFQAARFVNTLGLAVYSATTGKTVSVSSSGFAKDLDILSVNIDKHKGEMSLAGEQGGFFNPEKLTHALASLTSQLVLARSIGKVASKGAGLRVRNLRFSKQFMTNGRLNLRGQQYLNRATNGWVIGSLTGMATADIRKEALQGKLSEGQAEAVYGVMFSAMLLANQLSNSSKVFASSSVREPVFKEQLKNVIEAGLKSRSKSTFLQRITKAGADAAQGMSQNSARISPIKQLKEKSVSLFKKLYSPTGHAAGYLRDKGIIGANGYRVVRSATAEGMEEVLEEVFGSGVKSGANKLWADPDKEIGFKDVWKDLHTRLLQSFVLGAVGGAGAGVVTQGWNNVTGKKAFNSSYMDKTKQDFLVALMASPDGDANDFIEYIQKQHKAGKLASTSLGFDVDGNVVPIEQAEGKTNLNDVALESAMRQLSYANELAKSAGIDKLNELFDKSNDRKSTEGIDLLLNSDIQDLLRGSASGSLSTLTKLDNKIGDKLLAESLKEIQLEKFYTEDDISKLAEELKDKVDHPDFKIEDAKEALLAKDELTKMGDGRFFTEFFSAGLMGGTKIGAKYNLKQLRQVMVKLHSNYHKSLKAAGLLEKKLKDNSKTILDIMNSDGELGDKYVKIQALIPDDRQIDEESFTKLVELFNKETKKLNDIGAFLDSSSYDQLLDTSVVEYMKTGNVPLVVKNEDGTFNITDAKGKILQRNRGNDPTALVDIKMIRDFDINSHVNTLLFRGKILSNLQPTKKVKDVEFAIQQLMDSELSVDEHEVTNQTGSIFEKMDNLEFDYANSQVDGEDQFVADDAELQNMRDILEFKFSQLLAIFPNVSQDVEMGVRGYKRMMDDSEAKLNKEPDNPELIEEFSSIQDKYNEYNSLLDKINDYSSVSSQQADAMANLRAVQEKIGQTPTKIKNISDLEVGIDDMDVREDLFYKFSDKNRYDYLTQELRTLTDTENTKGKLSTKERENRAVYQAELKSMGKSVESIDSISRTALAAVSFISKSIDDLNKYKHASDNNKGKVFENDVKDFKKGVRKQVVLNELVIRLLDEIGVDAFEGMDADSVTAIRKLMGSNVVDTEEDLILSAQLNFSLHSVLYTLTDEQKESFKDVLTKANHSALFEVVHAESTGSKVATIQESLVDIAIKINTEPGEFEILMEDTNFGDDKVLSFDQLKTIKNLFYFTASSENAVGIRSFLEGMDNNTDGFEPGLSLTVQGIGGGGKSTAVFDRLLTLLRKADKTGKLSIVASANNASQVSVLNKIKNKFNGLLHNGSAYLTQDLLNMAESEMETVDVIVIDEASYLDLDAADVQLFLQRTKSTGTPVIFMGDAQQFGVNKNPIDTSNSKGMMQSSSLTKSYRSNIQANKTNASVFRDLNKLAAKFSTHYGIIGGTDNLLGGTKVGTDIFNDDEVIQNMKEALAKDTNFSVGVIGSIDMIGDSLFKTEILDKYPNNVDIFSVENVTETEGRKDVNNVTEVQGREFDYVFGVMETTNDMYTNGVLSDTSYRKVLYTIMSRARLLSIIEDNTTSETRNKYNLGVNNTKLQEGTRELGSESLTAEVATMSESYIYLSKHMDPDEVGAVLKSLGKQRATEQEQIDKQTKELGLESERLTQLSHTLSNENKRDTIIQLINDKLSRLNNLGSRPFSEALAEIQQLRIELDSIREELVKGREIDAKRRANKDKRDLYESKWLRTSEQVDKMANLESKKVATSEMNKIQYLIESDNFEEADRRLKIIENELKGNNAEAELLTILKFNETKEMVNELEGLIDKMENSEWADEYKQLIASTPITETMSVEELDSAQLFLIEMGEEVSGVLKIDEIAKKRKYEEKQKKKRELESQYNEKIEKAQELLSTIDSMTDTDSPLVKKLKSNAQKTRNALQKLDEGNRSLEQLNKMAAFLDELEKGVRRYNSKPIKYKKTEHEDGSDKNKSMILLKEGKVFLQVKSGNTTDIQSLLYSPKKFKRMYPNAKGTVEINDERITITVGPINDNPMITFEFNTERSKSLRNTYKATIRGKSKIVSDISINDVLDNYLLAGNRTSGYVVASNVRTRLDLFDKSGVPNVQFSEVMVITDPESPLRGRPFIMTNNSGKEITQKEFEKRLGRDTRKGNIGGITGGLGIIWLDNENLTFDQLASRNKTGKDSTTRMGIDNTSEMAIILTLLKDELNGTDYASGLIDLVTKSKWFDDSKYNSITKNKVKYIELLRTQIAQLTTEEQNELKNSLDNTIPTDSIQLDVNHTHKKKDGSKTMKMFKKGLNLFTFFESQDSNYSSNIKFHADIIPKIPKVLRDFMDTMVATGEVKHAYMQGNVIAEGSVFTDGIGIVDEGNYDMLRIRLDGINSPSVYADIPSIFQAQDKPTAGGPGKGINLDLESMTIEELEAMDISLLSGSEKIKRKRLLKGKIVKPNPVVKRTKAIKWSDSSGSYEVDGDVIKIVGLNVGGILIPNNGDFTLDDDLNVMIKNPNTGEMEKLGHNLKELVLIEHGYKPVAVKILSSLGFDSKSLITNKFNGNSLSDVSMDDLIDGGLIDGLNHITQDIADTSSGLFNEVFVSYTIRSTKTKLSKLINQYSMDPKGGLQFIGGITINKDVNEYLARVALNNESDIVLNELLSRLPSKKMKKKLLDTIKSYKKYKNFTVDTLIDDGSVDVNCS